MVHKKVKSLHIVLAMLGQLIATNSYAEGLFVDGGVSSRNLDYKGIETRQTTIAASAGYEFEYISLKISAGAPIQKEKSITQKDSFVEVTNLNGPVKSVDYSTTIESSGFFGAGVEAKWPIVKSWFLVGDLSYVSTGFDIQGYSLFSDHTPSANPAKDVNTDECFATGIESLCGVVISPYSEQIDLSGVQTSIGLEWYVSSDLSISMKYKSLHDNDVTLNGIEFLFRTYF